MEQAAGLWTRLDTRRRAIALGAAAVVFVAVLALARMSGQPTMALLYAGLDAAAAGEVVAALEQRDVAHEVRGDSIFVDAGLRDALRMGLAAEGLPAIGGGGYELLDQLSGFGTTAQMFDAAYLRAKEGELARTIAASPAVRAARVHLAVPQGQPFRRDLRPSASVTVTPRSGGVTPDQARALRHLVAASVAGMTPADVVVVDTVQGLVEDPSTAAGVRGGAELAQTLRASVERLLAARVGPGRAQVEVAVALVTERESITERRLDPQGRVQIATETEERQESSQGTAPGVTVASNLPDGEAQGGNETRSNATETRERVNFEVSEFARAVERAPGALARLSVAVLVDGTRAPDGTWQPRGEAELSDLRELVAAAVGLDPARGDVLTLRSLEFERPGAAEPAAPPPVLAGMDPMQLIQIGVIAAVALILGLFVLRPVLLAARAGPPAPLPLSLPAAAGALPVLHGEVAGPDEVALAPAPGAPEVAREAPPADPLERLRRLIAERQAESVEILRSWIEEREERR